jgi:hypothetical protein
LAVAQLARGAWARLVQQPVETAIEKTLPLLAGRWQRAVLPTRNLSVAQTIGSQKNDPRAHRQSLRRLRTSRPRLQLLALLRTECE